MFIIACNSQSPPPLFCVFNGLYLQRMPYYNFHLNQFVGALLWLLNWAALIAILVYSLNSSQAQGLSFLVMVGIPLVAILSFLFLKLRRQGMLDTHPSDLRNPFEFESTLPLLSIYFFFRNGAMFSVQFFFLKYIFFFQ